MNYKPFIIVGILALQERLISIIRENPNEIQLIEQTETLIDELKGVLK